MKLPFSIEQFLKVFENYNTDIWPFQIVLYIIGIFIILLALRSFYLSSKIISLALAFLWIWMGAVYHLMYFTSINKAAYVFGIAFMFEGIVFIYFAFIKKHITFSFQPGINGIVGAILMVYALFIYPVLGYMQGRTFLSSPGFGLPCPTTIFTLGILLWTDKKLPFVILAIPLLWSAIGFSAAYSLDIKEDTGLLISGFIFFVLKTFKNKKFNKPRLMHQP